jgi:hypothetical protein
MIRSARPSLTEVLLADRLLRNLCWSVTDEFHEKSGLALDGFLVGFLAVVGLAASARADGASFPLPADGSWIRWRLAERRE